MEIKTYYKGCLAGLQALNPNPAFTLDQLHILAVELTRKHFYHPLVYNEELEKFLKESETK